MSPIPRDGARAHGFSSSALTSRVRRAIAPGNARTTIVGLEGDGLEPDAALGAESDLVVRARSSEVVDRSTSWAFGAITGESGTKKEVLVRAIQEPAADAPLLSPTDA